MLIAQIHLSLWHWHVHQVFRSKRLYTNATNRLIVVTLNYYVQCNLPNIDGRFTKSVVAVAFLIRAILLSLRYRTRWETSLFALVKCSAYMTLTENKPRPAYDWIYSKRMWRGFSPSHRVVSGPEREHGPMQELQFWRILITFIQCYNHISLSGKNILQTGKKI